MALSEAQVIEALFASMNASFVRGVDAAKPQWNMVATEVPSSGASNLYGWLKDLPEIKEWVGDRQLAILANMAIKSSTKRLKALSQSSVKTWKTTRSANTHHRSALW